MVTNSVSSLFYWNSNVYVTDKVVKVVLMCKGEPR